MEPLYRTNECIEGFAPTNNFSHRPTYGKPRVGPHQFHARPGQHQHKFPQKVPKFNSDYDFETANKKFEEIAIGDLKDKKDGMGVML